MSVTAYFLQSLRNLVQFYFVQTTKIIQNTGKMYTINKKSFTTETQSCGKQNVLFSVERHFQFSTIIIFFTKIPSYPPLIFFCQCDICFQKTVMYLSKFYMLVIYQSKLS